MHGTASSSILFFLSTHVNFFCPQDVISAEFPVGYWCRIFAGKPLRFILKTLLLCLSHLIKEAPEAVARHIVHTVKQSIAHCRILKAVIDL